ncbi:MAG: hypothetical protein ACM3JB_07220 [Acidobacteriaceae bacterium]
MTAETKKKRRTDAVTELLKQKKHCPIAYYPAFSQIADGHVAAGLMLSQALYWSGRTLDDEGWFFKTASEWTKEIGLTRHEQDTCRRVLRDLGILKEKLRGMPARVHFQVDLCKLTELISQFAEKRQTTVCRKTTNRQIDKLDCRNPADTDAENQQAIKGTEITSETTSEISSTLRAALKAWLSMKDELQSRIEIEEWKLWVRPARLLTVMSGTQMLVALPPNGRIMACARAHIELLRGLARGHGYNVSLTRYPDDYERDRVRQEYPAFYEQMFGNGAAPEAHQ